MGALPTSATVAVIGAGTMGAGIAQVAAQAGHPVLLYDAAAGAAERGVQGILRTLGKLVDKGRLGADALADIRGRLRAAATLEELAPAGLVIEAIVENLDVKRELFARLEALVAADAILATNTSSISVTAIAAKLGRPGRLAGMHFFNPAPLMKLVEVVSGLATSAEVAARVHATCEAWGKAPVHAKSTPGFIVNRVARPYYAEGLRLLGEGAADVATLDALLREAGGFRMGPFELMDLIGHDVNFAVTSSVFAAYFNDPRFTPSLIQQELVAAGYLGRKSGRGFYDYAEGAPAHTPATLAPGPAPQAVHIAGPLGVAEPLIERLRAGGVVVTHGEGSGLIVADGVTLALTDGRSATERAWADDLGELVLFDLALDFASTPRLALAAAEQAAPGAILLAAGLLRAAGIATSRLTDVPGLAVMRTVAMLANEGADAVNQGVCSAAAVDVAMQGGVNYPRGPLAWADAIGLPEVLTVLDNLAASYGEDRYRASPLLRRHVYAKRRFHD
ncbi:3-hydroxyacyl-CoA dehydrogenase [Plasticicumulans lactativorans]|uniref:3-hydroxyacyl-CoA dehydrogenase n=1 Tax=Plasticicumulans lactativorans TaxID=1133106 RepID=A0A4R2LAL3_9GAMM|nr:3-hydroxyacyl-CoA dehydrogenase PaaH [Plasticicumulans lactativorans]TCO81259.1 3-hydroxyacyl-CoA dehydrogenase [Plasticicumulans lactativorans]